jgi:hypothetical protein
MPIKAYVEALKQTTNDLTWIARELERLTLQQKQLTALENCLKQFVPNDDAAQKRNTEGEVAAAEAAIAELTEAEAVSSEVPDPARPEVEAVKV